MVYRWVDRSIGERSRPLAVVPPVTVAFARENQIFPNREPTEIRVRLASNQAEAVTEVRLDAPRDWQVEPASQTLRFDRMGQEKTAVLHDHPASRCFER